MPRTREEYNEYMREYMKARYYRRRAAAIEQLGGKCVDCGSTKQLEIDHAIAADKSFDIGKAFAGWSEVRLQAELGKCVIRCNPCHKAKSIAAGDKRTVPHGGGVSGKRNCPCDPCRARKRVYMREWEAKQRLRS